MVRDDVGEGASSHHTAYEELGVFTPNAMDGGDTALPAGMKHLP